MAKISAGILMYRKGGDVLEFLLVHPGGPLWAKKDWGMWSIPKGEVGRDEDPLDAAKREFYEETGLTVGGQFIPLSAVKLRSGKVVQAWAFEGDCDPAEIKSNTFSMEWPPRSGKRQEFPEVDRAAWFGFEEARKKINQGQVGLLEELRKLVSN